MSFEAENEDASEMEADKQKSEMEDVAEEADDDNDTDRTALAQEFAAIPELDEVLSEGRKVISRIYRKKERKKGGCSISQVVMISLYKENHINHINTMNT